LSVEISVVNMPINPAITTKPVVVHKITAEDQQIAALKSAIAEAKNRTVIKEVASEGTLYPPNPVAGQCYARVLTPAKYEMIKEKVLSSDASEKLQVIPAKYTWTKKRVLVKEASERIVAVPATFKVIKEKVLVAPASQKIISTPPIYETVKEKILVTPAHTAWRKGRGPVEKLDNATCEILCLVNIPAVYKVVTKRILKTPASTKSVPVPAVYKTISKRVIDSPASTKSVTVPAQYKIVKVKELLEPASIKRTEVPQIYKTIEKRVKISDSVLKWQKVACKNAITRVNIKGVQRALKNSGFNPGPIDGIMGWRTKSALNKFQKSQGISTGALTQETLASLGL